MKKNKNKKIQPELFPNLEIIERNGFSIVNLIYPFCNNYILLQTPDP